MVKPVIVANVTINCLFPGALIGSTRDVLTSSLAAPAPLLVCEGATMRKKDQGRDVYAITARKLNRDLVSSAHNCIAALNFIPSNGVLSSLVWVPDVVVIDAMFMINTRPLRRTTSTIPEYGS